MQRSDPAYPEVMTSRFDNYRAGPPGGPPKPRPAVQTWAVPSAAQLKKWVRARGSRTPSTSMSIFSL